jgi:glucan phosphoethanolaminetransferase (alkaline phosphatase superfamily)
MKADITRLPGWGKVAGIIAGILAIAVLGWFIVATNMSRPISQMPWYYWLLITLLLLALLFIITRRQPDHFSKMSVMNASVQAVISAITLSVFIASLVKSSTTGQDLFMALAWLPSGITGTLALYQRW